jgi:GNAT superfamily N-acetyltransferase
MQVMGANGAYAGCWCMFWRLTNQEIQGKTGADNRAALEATVCSGAPAGLILYADDVPVGWCSVAPRPAFPRLFHTNGLSLRDPHDASVWSVVCIYMGKGRRRLGLASALLDAAVTYAQTQGAAVVEGYPVVDADQGKRAGLSSGTIGLFTRAGFTRQSHDEAPGRRVVMRRVL